MRAYNIPCRAFGKYCHKLLPLNSEQIHFIAHCILYIDALYCVLRPSELNVRLLRLLLWCVLQSQAGEVNAHMEYYSDTMYTCVILNLS